VINHPEETGAALRGRALIGVVDDDPSVRKALARLLRAAGFDVVAHASAVELLVALHQRPVQCLVLDIHLEGMGGLDLHSYLTDAGIRLPVVFITAHDDPATRQRAEQARQVYLRKPVDSHELLDAIASLIGRDTASTGSGT
jgi:FixJ family two-component response regulator